MPHYIEYWLEVFIDFAQTFGVLYCCWRWHFFDRTRLTEKIANRQLPSHLADLDRLALEIERADPPWSAEQRAKAWQSIARTPESIEAVRAVVAATTITKPTLVRD